MFHLMVSFPRELGIRREGGDITWETRKKGEGSISRCHKIFEFNTYRTIGAVWIEDDNRMTVEVIREGPNEQEENISAALGI